MAMLRHLSDLSSKKSWEECAAICRGNPWTFTRKNCQVTKQVDRPNSFQPQDSTRRLRLRFRRSNFAAKRAAHGDLGMNKELPEISTILHHFPPQSQISGTYHPVTSFYINASWLVSMFRVSETPLWGLRHQPATRPAISSSIRCEMIEPTGAKGVAQTCGYWYAATSNTSIPVGTRKQNVQITPELGVHFVTVPMHCSCDLPQLTACGEPSEPCLSLYPHSLTIKTPSLYPHDLHLKLSISIFQRLTRETATFVVASSLLQSRFESSRWSWPSWPQRMYLVLQPSSTSGTIDGTELSGDPSIWRVVSTPVGRPFQPRRWPESTSHHRTPSVSTGMHPWGRDAHCWNRQPQNTPTWQQLQGPNIVRIHHALLIPQPLRRTVSGAPGLGNRKGILYHLHPFYWFDAPLLVETLTVV